MSLLASRRFAPLFWTQFLGAFNDNVYKQAILLYIVFGSSQWAQSNADLLVNIAAGLFILPFFLLSSLAGQITDKYEKSTLVRRVKLIEIIIMSAATICFWLDLPIALFALLFLMGSQSTFFGPAKYALLPQHLRPEELVKGNAWFEMATFVSIILGTIAAGILMSIEDSLLWVSLTLMSVSLLGYLTSRRIPHAPSSDSTLSIDWNPFRSTIALLRQVKRNKTVFTGVLAISWFWFLGASFLTQFPNFAKVYLLGDTSVVTCLLVMFTVGIALGSATCSILSRGQINLRLSLFGLLGVVLCSAHLAWLPEPILLGETQPTALHWTALFEEWRTIRALLDTLAIGFFGGWFIVPLYAHVLAKTEPQHRARMVSVINIINALFMVVSALFAIVILVVLGWTLLTLFAILSIASACVLVGILIADEQFRQ